MRFSAFPLLLLAPPLLAQAGTRSSTPPTRAARASDSTAKRDSANPLAAAVAGLRVRSIGPAMTSGRVVSIAVDPRNPAVFYVGSASGGVWKTTNAGASWTPVFDREGSYSIGYVAIDPKRPNVVWVGTGEANAQRSVSYGDGVYRSDDGGKSWKRVGLERSEHIGKIIFDPRNTDVVYVAAQGPLWGPGGDRGLYKTTDGGKTWKQVLAISENTGVSDVALDPRNPDVLIATAYQRRRHFWTLVDGGPESAIHRSTDGGATWTRVSSGLPTEELGRIGIAISPANPDIVYATVEAANRRGGIFRSTDNGVTWEKRSDYQTGAMYYGVITADPADADRIYLPDVFFQVSDDGGRTMRNLGQRYMHVDNHVIWIDPANASHYLVGNDGGVYESHDRGATWQFKANLPLSQFYDVAVDNNAPFYFVYGGLQDNNSLGGPSRTRSLHGITNADWFETQGGDGFVSRVDPEDPNTVYSELQHGVIVRFDKRTHERIGIQPKEGAGEPPLRWNWDAPFIISPHAHTRLYMGANKLFRSDDRGDTWRAISGDLTRQLDRNALPVMGRIQRADAVAKNTSTAFYGNISAVAESPKREGLLYVGTDDGLIQVSEDAGGAWRKVERFPGVPERAYVARVIASQHDAQTVYAAFDNHQSADFAPYLLRSTDAGRTWSSIVGDLPARGTVYAFAEDHVDPTLLFAGTEFGAYVSRDGGAHWVRLGGLPTIAVRDIAIQRQMNDLVLATFGRGLYILDDYSPLRRLTPAVLAQGATLLGARDGVSYIPTHSYGLRGKAFQGESFYTAENPPYGATFTYHIKDPLETLAERRRREEREAERAGRTAPYPTADQLRAEASEEPPALLLTVMDSTGKPIRTLTGPATKGVQRVAWDLRVPAPVLPRPRANAAEGEDLFDDPPTGPLVLPGRYSVSLARRVGGVVTPLGEAVPFRVVADPQGVATVADRAALWSFQERLTDLSRRVSGSLELTTATRARLDAILRALDQTPAAPRQLHERARALSRRLDSATVELRGDRALASRSEPVPPAISQRVDDIRQELARTLSRPTSTHEEQYRIAARLYDAELVRLRALVDVDLPALERELDAARAPYTPGRVGTRP